MEGLKQYFARRVIQAVVVLCLVSLAGFSLLHLAPGGPAAIYALSPTMSSEDLDRITHEFGLDRPIHVQYLSWAKGFLSGNWGRSYRDGRVVLEVILDRVPATVILMLSAFSVAVLLGLASGIVSAVRQYSLFDHAGHPRSHGGAVDPHLLAGPHGDLRLLGAAPLPPAREYRHGGRAVCVRRPPAPPRLAGGYARRGMVATWSRYTRASMLEVIGEDYIRTARAKGVSQGRVILKHALRNALIPLVTLAGLQLPLVFSGALVTETIFTWPGMGRLFVDSIGYRDYPVLMGILVFTATLVILGNLVADLVYAAIDPRVRHS